METSTEEIITFTSTVKTLLITEVESIAEDGRIPRFAQLVIFILSLLDIAITSIIIYVIVRYKKMRNNRTNLCILNCCISMILLLLSGPVLIGFLEGMFQQFTYTIYSFAIQLSPAFLIAKFSFILLMSWNRIFSKCSQICFNRIVISIWSVVGVYSLATAAICAWETLWPLYMRYFGAMLVGVMFCTILVRFIFFVIDVLMKNHIEGETFRITIVGYYTVICIVSVLTYIFGPHRFHIFMTILLSLVFAFPFYNAYLLARLDKNFKLCFAHVAGCCKGTDITEKICYENSAASDAEV